MKIFLSPLKVMIISFIVIYTSMSWPLSSLADEEAKAAQKIISLWQDSIVTIKMTITSRVVVQGRQMKKGEEQLEAIGAVMDQSGLVVASLAGTDPSGIIATALAFDDANNNMSVESDISDVKLIFPDNQELDAKIVLRDKDLDLVFIRPLKAPAPGLKALDFSSGCSCQMLDQLIILSRMGKTANREIAVSLARIQAIVKKPRLFYIPDQSLLSAGLGAPAFTLGGKVAGLLLLRVPPAQSMQTASMLGGGMGMLAVIVPAKDILEVSKQIQDQETKK